MKFKLLILIFAMFLLVPNVLAVLTNQQMVDATSVYILGTTVDSGNHNRALTLIGSPENSTTSCPNGKSQCMYFDGVTDQIKINNDDGFFTSRTNRTICFIGTNVSTIGGNLAMYDEREVGGAGTEDLQFYGDTNQITVNYNDEGGTPASTLTQAGTVWPSGTHALLCAGVRWGVGGSSELNVSVYLNNSQIGVAIAATTTADTFTNQDISLMSRHGSAPVEMGVYAIWLGNITLTTDVTNFFMNDGITFGDIEFTPAVTGFELTLIDSYDSVALKNFTATIFNSTDIFINTTTEGLLSYGNLTNGLYNINITKINDTGGYFNQTFTDIDVSNDFQATAFQSVLLLTVLDGLNNLSVSAFQADTNLSSQTTTNGEILILVKKGFFQLNVTAAGFEKLVTNFSRIALENSSFNVTLGSIFNFNLIRETTNEVFDFNNTNATLTIFCKEQTITVTFNTSSNVSQIINCEFDLMQMTVDYGILGNYFRTLIPPFSQKNITWYLIDIRDGDTAIQRIINLLDLTGEFNNAKLTVERAVGGIIRTIIEQRFDISNNVNLFLVQNGLYTLSIDNDKQDITLGNLIPTEAGTQTITLPKIDFVPQETILGGNVSWSYTHNISTGILRMQYEDVTNQTTLVRFTVRNETNFQLFQAESNNNASVIITFNQAVGNRTYLTELFVKQTAFTNFTENRVFYQFGDSPQGALNLPGFSVQEQKDIKKWIAFIFLIGWVLIFSALHSGLAVSTLIFWLWLFRQFQWIEVSGIVFGFVALIAVVAWIVEGMKKN